MLCLRAYCISSTVTFVTESDDKEKAKIVTEDERELGIRAILNFGHTYGHAIEAKNNYKNIELHLVGPLQSNKAKDAVSIFDCIQTVDREKIAKILKKEEENLKKKLFYMIQINTGKESQKSGVMPDYADDFFKYCKEDLKLNIQGLMCIPPYGEDSSIHFAYLRKKNLEYKLPYLSMGMSDDYEKAITFGATHIRIGTAIFGERPQK